MTEKKGSFIALFPLLIFVLLFVGTGIISGDFSNMPLNVAIIIASAVALVMNRKEKLSAKIEIFAKGAGHPNIMLLVVIFILAGAFAETAKGMGGVEATVNMGLSLIPSNLLMVGLFIVGCFILIINGDIDGNCCSTCSNRNWYRRTNRNSAIFSNGNSNWWGNVWG